MPKLLKIGAGWRRYMAADVPEGPLPHLRPTPTAPTDLDGPLPKLGASKPDTSDPKPIRTASITHDVVVDAIARFKARGGIIHRLNRPDPRPVVNMVQLRGSR